MMIVYESFKTIYVTFIKESANSESFILSLFGRITCLIIFIISIGILENKAPNEELISGAAIYFVLHNIILFMTSSLQS